MIKAKDLESVAERLSNLGLPFKEIIAQEKIDRSASEYNFNIRTANGVDDAVYHFCIKREKGENNKPEYVIHDYQAKMLIVPIQHGFHAGIDTNELEKAMKEIVWSLFPVYKRETIADFFGKIDQLRNSREADAMDIADKLSIKYFSNTALENILPLPDKTPYEKTILIPIYNNGNDVDIDQAVQLLKGDALLKYRNSEGETAELCWLKEDNGYIKVYPDFDLSGILQQMPMVRRPDIIQESEILAELGNGKSYATSLLINNRIVEGSISVDPVNATLEFRNTQGNSVNWKLWTKIKQNKKPGKGKKGPGL